MIDDLRAITLFVQTVERGSFKKCADYFGMSPSLVSQQISQLEKKYATTLLYRSTRKLSLTPEGRAFFDQAQPMVKSAHDALSVLSHQTSHPSGDLTLSLPAGLIKSPLSDKIARFSKDYPDIKLDIQYSDARIDLIEQGIDLAIRVGKMQDSALKSKKIMTIRRRMVCTKDYFAKHSSPAHGNDLADWDWIKMKMMPPYRILFDPTGNAHKIGFEARITVDNVEAMCHFTRCGLGLSTPPDYLVLDDLANGELIEVLPNWTAAPMDVYAVWPENNVRRKLTGLLLDHICRD